MTTETANQDDEPGRRDFIHLLAGSVAAVGAAGVVWPLVQQMNPDASVLALSSTEVDLSAVVEGSAIKVFWRGKPVFIRRRTAAEVAQAEETPLSALKDKDARNANLGGSAEATDADRRVKAEWMIVVGVCTHLGCIPLGTDDGDTRGDYNGWFCPCHGSHYDIAGRVRKGPAPENLEVPPYTFLTDTTIKIG
ncbi:MAG: ubiquinol-cytochrome c reductase iron-sulfur subunit [Pseudomonadota bacterium]